MSKKNIEVAEWLSKLSKDDMLCIIKYGLRGSGISEEITSEDIFDCIGCMYIGEQNEVK